MKLIMENWKRFLNESSEPSGPPWSEPAQVLAALAQRGYEPLGNDPAEVEDYIATMLTSAPVRQWEVTDWISTLDGEWIIHPAKEKERIEKQKQREKDTEYQKRWDDIERKRREMSAAVDSIDWATTDLGHPKGLEEHKQQILDYLEENNIVLTEEELAEAMSGLGKRLAAAGLAASLGLSTATPAQANPIADFFRSKAQTHQVDQAQQADQQQADQESETKAQEGYSVVDGVHYFFVKGEPGDYFAERQAQQNLMRKLVGQGGPLEGESTVHGAVKAGYKDGMHGYMWSTQTAANAKQMIQQMQQMQR